METRAVDAVGAAVASNSLGGSDKENLNDDSQVLQVIVTYKYHVQVHSFGEIRQSLWSPLTAVVPPEAVEPLISIIELLVAPDVNAVNWGNGDR